MFGRPSQRSGSGQGTLPKVRKWLKDPPGGPEVVETPSRRSGSGRETLPEIQKWSGDPPKGVNLV